MRLEKSFKFALNIIFHSKLRSWLTIIGIVIGIAAIISIVSLGQGAQRTLESNLNSLSADIITISPGHSRAVSAGADFRGSGEGSSSINNVEPKNLTVKDLMILKSVPNILYVMGTISGSLDSSFLDKSSRLQIQGVDPSIWKSFTSTELSSGRYLTQGDTGVVVVGGRIASSIFTNLEINRQIIIGGRSFRIVGILKESGSSDDSRVFMPIDNAGIMLEKKDVKNFDSISLKIKDISLTDDTISQVTSKLLLSHGILQSSKADFSINSLKSIQQRVSTTLNSMSLFLTAIAAISLLVGAIGIMNTQFTSVLEKTKEIGILKAIGARNKDILTIFLLNSGIIGLIGGVFGVIFGVIGSSYIAQLAGFSSVGRFTLTSSVSTSLIIEVFLLSIAVGLIAGAIPAYRASRLRPVDALRYE